MPARLACVPVLVGAISAMGQTATCLPKCAMSALTPRPEVIWRRRRPRPLPVRRIEIEVAVMAGGPNVAQRATLPDLRDRMKEAARLRRPLGLFVMWAVVDRAMIATD
jgi:hypothetical protein